MRNALAGWVAALAGLILVLASACGGDDDTNGEPGATATPRPERVTFMAGFRPQANLPFVAAYVAHEKGFFAEEGLEVDIRHSGGGDEHIQLLLGGRVDFTTHLASGVLQQRTQEPKLPLKAFVLWGHSSPAGFVTLKESGIDSIEKFEGKRYGFKQKVTHEYLATLDAVGLDRSKIQEVSVGFDPSIILSGQIDILAVFLNNEPWVIEHRLGKEVNVFDPADFGVETLGLTYVATEDTIDKRSDVVERFTRATLRGAEWAIENEEEAISIVLKRMDAGEDAREHQTFLFREDVRQARSAVTGAKGIGAMTLEQWQTNADMLVRYNLTSEPPDVASAFAAQFVDEFYAR